MDQVPVTLKFVRERKNRRTGLYPFFLEVTIPLEGRPKMLPECEECTLYATEVASENAERVTLRFAFIPQPEGSSQVDVLITTREVMMWVRKAAPWMEEAWKARRVVRTAGTLKDEEHSFTISFSARRAK